MRDCCHKKISKKSTQASAVTEWAVGSVESGCLDARESCLKPLPRFQDGAVQLLFHIYVVVPPIPPIVLLELVLEPVEVSVAHSAPAMPEAPFRASPIAAAGDEPDAPPSLLPPVVNMEFPSDDMAGCVQISGWMPPIGRNNNYAG